MSTKLHLSRSRRWSPRPRWLAVVLGGAVTVGLLAGLQPVSQAASRPVQRSPALARSGAIFVSNLTGNSITEYAMGSNGDASPVTTISGGNTGLDMPGGLAMDSSGDLFVADPSANSVIEFGPDASGNATPVATISGPDTGLDRPVGVAVDGAGDIFVANETGHSITEYRPGSDGDAVPVATIAGSLTGIAGPLGGRVGTRISGPTGVAVTSSGIVLESDINSVINEFPPGASGNVPPMASIAGSKTGLEFPAQPAIGPSGNVYVANELDNSVTGYALGATGNAAPTATIAGSNTGLSTPEDIAFDAAGDLFVPSGNQVSEFAPGANGNATPVATISGEDTGLNGPVAIAIETPSLVSTTVTIHAVEGKPFNGVVTTLDCPNAEPPRSAHIFISWYDGGPYTTAKITIAGDEIEVSGSHTYAQAGTWDSELYGSYVCGKSSISVDDNFSAVVADAPLTATGHAFTVEPGQAFSGTVATFTDANPGGVSTDYTATISWGDGATGSGSIAAGRGGVFSVTGSHTYTTGGPYTVTVTIDDFGGSTATATTTALVGTAPSAGFTLSAGPTKAGHPVSFNASGSHSPLTNVSNYRWTISGAGVLHGTYTATCPGYDSGMETSFQSAGTVKVNLDVDYAAGLTSSVSHDAVTSAAKVGKTATRVVGIDTQWILCSRLSSDPIVDPTENGGPPAGCQDEYFAGPIDAVGCFTDISNDSQIPAPEYKMICPYLAVDPCAASSASSAADTRRVGGPSQSGVVTIPPGLSPTTSTVHCPTTQTVCNNGVYFAEDSVISSQTVRVNGLDVTPDPGAVFLLDQNDGVMASSDATISLLDGKLPLSHGPLLETGFDYEGDLPLLDTNLATLEAQSPALASDLDLGGFLLDGTLTVDLVNGVSHIGASLQLPHPFTGAGGVTLGTQINLTADNQNGLQLDDLQVQVQSAYFAGGGSSGASSRNSSGGGPRPSAEAGETSGNLLLEHVFLCFQRHVYEGFCQKQTGADFGALDSSSLPSWNIGADINLLGAELNASPPPPDQGLGFVGGQFDFGGLTFTLPDPGIPLGDSGLSLTSIGAALGLHPTRFNGTIGLTAAGLVTISGFLFLVFASPSQPYSFTGTELGPNVPLPTPTVTNFAIAAAGTVGVAKLPVIGSMSLYSGYVLYAYPAYLALGGGLDVSLAGGDLVLVGYLSGQVALNTGAFEVSGTVEAHTPLFTADANGVVSNIGAAACASIGTLFGNVAAGAGYTWSGGFSTWLGSCDLSSYVPVITASPAAAHGAATAAADRVTVPAGLASEMIKLSGSHGAPDVTITGPHGIKASNAGPALVERKPFVIYQVPNENTTYIAVIKPPAGVYTITASKGSAAITGVFTAHPVTPSIRGRVTGSGRVLVLHYSARGLDGQKLLFFDKEGSALWKIGSATAAAGTLRFVPAPGPAGVRQVVAELVSGNAPVVLRDRGGPSADSQLVVAKYHAPGPPQYGKVGHLTVRHVGARVLVGFAAVRGAGQYAIMIRLSSGQHWQVLTNKRSIAIAGVPGEISGTVTVQALGNDATSSNGPASSAKIAAEYRIKR
jgi:hypothetical protein